LPEDIVPIRATALPPVLRRFCLLFAALTLLSELWSAIGSLVFHRRPPYGGTFSWDDAGQDLLIFRPRFLAFHTPHFWDAGLYPFTYPAPLGVIYWLLYKLPHLVEIYLAFSIAALLLWVFYFARKLNHSAAMFALLTIFLAASWPVRFLLQTGNMESIVALLLGLGIIAALQQRWRLAATLIGIAGSMKLYPLALLAFLLSQRRFREFIWGIVVAAIATLVSLAILGPSIPAAELHIANGLAFLQQRYILAPLPDGLQFSHSLFNLVKLGVFLAAKLRGISPVTTQAAMSTALQLYVPIVAIGALLLYLRIRRLPPLNQVIALTVCAVLLPPFSLDYTLVELLVPFGLLCIFCVEAWHKHEQPTGLALSFTCFAILFSTGAFFELNYRFAAQARTVALIVLLATVLRHRFEPKATPA
jgi:hypothetical protein